MWKPNNTERPAQPDLPPDPPANTGVPRHQPTNGGLLAAQQPHALIGKSIVIKGDVVGAESLYLEGRVEGSVDLTGHYFHVGQNASVDSNVTARELIVRGTVNGKVTIEDRLEIRTGGSLIGDVMAKRVSIEDGAYFKGSIDMRRPEQQKVQPPVVMKPDKPAEPVALSAVVGK